MTVQHKKLDRGNLVMRLSHIWWETDQHKKEPYKSFVYLLIVFVSEREILHGKLGLGSNLWTLQQLNMFSCLVSERLQTHDFNYSSVTHCFQAWVYSSPWILTRTLYYQVIQEARQRDVSRTWGVAICTLNTECVSVNAWIKDWAETPIEQNCKKFTPLKKIRAYKIQIRRCILGNEMKTCYAIFAEKENFETIFQLTRITFLPYALSILLKRLSLTRFLPWDAELQTIKQLGFPAILDSLSVPDSLL